VILLPAVEHVHRCVYCGTRWFCLEDCLFAGPSACEKCALSLEPDTPRRVIPLRDTWILDRLTEQAAQRFRARFRRERPD
jgi:hypothetical protein